MISTFSVLARLALGAAVLAALAGDQWPVQPAAAALVPGPVAVVIVRPAAGHSPAQAPAASDCTSQNLRASLRPPGAMPAPGQMPAGSTMARIVKQGYLIAGVLEDVFPFSFRDASLRPEGFDVDVARDIAGALFGDREKVVFRPLREAARLEALQAGQVDLVIAAVTVTCKRRELVNFSTVYFEAGQRVLVNRSSGFTSLSDMRGRRVCAARGSTSLGTISSYPSKPIPVGAATETDCLMLLQLGNVDAVSTDDTLLAGMAAQDPRTDIVGPPLNEEPYAVAISNTAPDLVRFVNAVLERRAQDGRWRASYERWLKLLGPVPSPPAPQYRD
jgi:polar amino acid transport system substrate-binding protein